MVALNVSSLHFTYFKPPDTDSITTRRGITDCKAIGIVVYYDFMVLVSTKDYSFVTQMKGQFAILIKYPVLDLTLSRFVISSVPHPQAKAASTYTFVLADSVSIGLDINSLPRVPSRYRPMQMRDNL